MLVHSNPDQLPLFKNAVVTIGTFDGVHAGHRKIINQLKEEAVAVQGETVLISFHPHPRKVVGDTSGVSLITTLEEKIQLLDKQGIDHLVIVPFDESFSNQTADEYVSDFLYRKFKPHTVIIGYDHKFGKGRHGDYHLLEDYGAKLGFIVKEIPEHILNEIVISSTQIRKALLHSDLATANDFLGYPYFFQGKVIEGDKIGRTIGYPTANIQLDNEEKLVPGDGIYAVRVCMIDDSSYTIDDSPLPTGHSQYYSGMLYIGSRPVVNGKRRVIEVNIFDFDQDIYGKTIKVEMHYYVRGDIHFTSLEALKVKLADDKVQSLELLKGSYY